MRVDRAFYCSCLVYARDVKLFFVNASTCGLCTRLKSFKVLQVHVLVFVFQCVADCMLYSVNMYKCCIGTTREIITNKVSNQNGVCVCSARILITETLP